MKAGLEAIHLPMEGIKYIDNIYIYFFSIQELIIWASQINECYSEFSGTKSEQSCWFYEGYINVTIVEYFTAHFLEQRIM